MPSPPPNAIPPEVADDLSAPYALKPLNEQHVRDHSRNLEVHPPGTKWRSSLHGEVVAQLPADAYALFAGEEVAKALNAALCALLDVPDHADRGTVGSVFRDIRREHKPVLGLVRDTLSASLLGRKCAEGTL